MIDLSKRIANLSPEKRELLRQQLKKKRGDVIRTPISPQKRDSHAFPLSFAQQRLWFLDQLEPGNSTYNIYAAVRLRGPLNVAALEQSLNEILRRHEALRTTFATVEGQPIQMISSPEPFTLSIADLRQFPETEREPEARRLATEEARRPFDLARGPLLRTTLLRLSEEDHILLLTMHHIISDGWSRGVLYRELSALYEAFSAGKPSPLPEPPIQYADFAVWQRQWLQGKTLEVQLSYWKKQLEGAPSVLEVPTDRPRPAVQTFRGARQSLVLSKSLTEAVKALSRQEGATLFMTLLAAFKTLLHRYTGQDDIIVGSPIAGRNRPEVEGLIGFFVNTLVLRTDLSGNPSFRELLSRVREIALEAYAHQDLPFEKLVEELQPERNLSHSPLFQVMFVLQNTPGQALELPDLKLNPMEVDNDTAKFDLTLSVVEGTEGLQGTFEYNTDLLDAVTVKRMVGHLRTLLEGTVANPEQRIEALPLLTEAERHQLLVEWNDTQANYPKDLCIHQLFEAQVERTPEAVAVVSEEQQLTYRELNTRANQLAHYLRKRGVGPDVLVGICVERSLEMVIGLLGILKAGGAYVPLDPAYPKERLVFMLEDTQAPAMLTQQQLVEKLPEHGAKVVCLDSDWEAIAGENDKNPSSGVMANNQAYVIYTSGSTGRPKGVAIEHRSAVALSYWASEVFSSEDLSGVLASTSLCFDLSVFELFVPLSQGGRVILAENALQLPTLSTADEVTLVNTVPSVIAELLKMNGVPPSVRTINLAGEPLKVSLVDQIYQQTTVQQVFDLYGPSEDTTYSTFALRRPGAPATIGRPIANTGVYILDPHLQPVPIGVPGEIYIGGVSLARGYLNRPELTAKLFIPNPFNDEAGARLYKTGDLARYLPDGNIQFLGRIDHQVKIRGFRIELGEIEAVLGQHPAVQETVVVAREDIPGDKRLVAYLVIKQGPVPTFNELRSFLKEKLPEYMVPSAFMFLDALPLTPNGKVDRRALPAPDRVRPELERAFVASRTPIEEMLAGIWVEVLGLEQVGIHDNFFELGGHSLLTVRLFTQIEKTFGKKLPLAALFQAPTIEQLASVLHQKGWSTPWSSLVAIQPSGSKPPLFCVPGILGNVFTDLGDLARHLGPDQPFYGLQDGIQNPSQIKALAAHYVDEIRTVQPEGPYLLGGVCSGGVVAFEMAQQLQAQGQKVALLALVEPSSLSVPGLRAYFNLLVSILRRAVQRSSYHSRNLLQRSSAEQGAYIRLKVKLIANMWALARYTPQPYPGQIHFFLASESLAKSPQDPHLGWRELAAGRAEVYKIPGTHDAITRTHDAIPEESHLQVLAEQLRACIDEALEEILKKPPVGRYER